MSLIVLPEPQTSIWIFLENLQHKAFFQCFVFTIILALPTLVVAQSDKLEYSRSIWDLSCQPINNIAKDCSVTDCGVRRY